MKTSHFLRILGIVFLACVAIVVSGIAPVRQGVRKSLSVKELPPIVLERCINVQKFIGRNPFSPMPNEYLLVTKYEEKPEEAGAVKESFTPGRALNIYLVHGLRVLKNLGTGIVHGTVLIVKVITTDVKSSCETVREWIFIDEDGDRNVDRGVFRETVREEGKGPIGWKETEFPPDRLNELQAYYEMTTMTLTSKAESGPTERCVIT
jgi:hypothetical protein